MTRRLNGSAAHHVNAGQNVRLAARWARKDGSEDGTCAEKGMSGLTIEVRETGLLIAVRAHAGARKNSVCGVHDGVLRVHVAVAPEKGKANRAIAETIAKFLGIRRSQIEIASGLTSPQKKFFLMGITVAEIQQRVVTLESQE